MHGVSSSIPVLRYGVISVGRCRESPRTSRRRTIRLLTTGETSETGTSGQTTVSRTGRVCERSVHGPGDRRGLWSGQRASVTETSGPTGNPPRRSMYLLRPRRPTSISSYDNFRKKSTKNSRSGTSKNVMNHFRKMKRNTVKDIFTENVSNDYTSCFYQNL